jgi:CHAT domain-containing protein
MEALSRQYDKEERLIFFQHGIYKDVKSAIQLHIMLGHIDSAFMKVSYVKGRALRGRLAGPKTEYLDIASMQKSLQSNEAIIDYMVTADTLYAFVLTRSKLQLFRVHESKLKLQASVDEYLRYLTDDSPFQVENDEKHFRKLFLRGIKLSNRLYNKLFQKMAHQLLKMDRLFIIPDEFLYALPFNTLALHDGADTRFLIEDKAIMVLPSAWTLVTQPEKKEAKKEEFDLLASIVPDMHGAQKIAKHISTLFGKRAHIHTKWEGKNSFTTHLAKGYETYLFFAHAEANWDEPRESFIEFPLSTSHLTGQLSYQDIDSLGWRKAALVILAGCETSGSRIYLGAGLAGLQSAFLAAGARQVMATYWKVDAAQVADQISLFLKEWIGHSDAMLALQAMQKTSILQMKRDPYFKYPHPHLWGAYNLTGIKLDIGNLIDLAGNRSSKQSIF